MKTQIWQRWPAGLLALGLPVLAGCAANSEAQSPAQSAQPTNAAVATGGPSDSTAPLTNVLELAEEAAAEVAPPEHPEPAPGSELRPLPADLKLSPGAAEIAKLARAGINEAVLLAFVTNSSGTFNLGSDQIVYLNDLGVSSDVIAAMIEHDRLLREGGGVLPPLAAAGQPTASSPAQPDAAAIAAAAAPQPLPGASASSTNAPPPAAATEPVAAPVTNVTYNYFYESLAPYGTWVEVDGYGYCWQPSVVVVNAGWRPYLHGGRWIYTDYGWYWHSDYSWGWAPFHYGRWFVHPRWGWLWWPDTVWGPAWVTWRYTDAYCGWAPLPPAARWVSGVGLTYYGRGVSVSFGFGLGWGCFAYVPWTHFHGHRPHLHHVPPHRVVEIHRRATCVTHVVAHGDQPVHPGIGEERVRQHTGAELRPIRVREERVVAPATRLSPGERLERGRGELVVRRPDLPSRPAPPVPDLRGSGHTRGATIRDTGEQPTIAASPPPARPSSPPRNAARVAETSAPGKRGAASGPPAVREAPGRPQRQEGPPRPSGSAPPRSSGTPERQSLAGSSTPAASQAAQASPVNPPANQEGQRANEPGSRVTVIGRRPAPGELSANRLGASATPPNRAGSTYTWTRPADPRSGTQASTSRYRTVDTPPAQAAPAPQVAQPTTPAKPGLTPPQTVRPPTSAPSPTARQPGLSVPQTARPPTPPPSTIRPEARSVAPQPPPTPPGVMPAPSVPRPGVLPDRAPAFRPAPSAPVVVPAPRGASPGAPAPRLSAPAPNPAPAPATGSATSSGRSAGGRPNLRQER